LYVDALTDQVHRSIIFLAFGIVSFLFRFRRFQKIDCSGFWVIWVKKTWNLESVKLDDLGSKSDGKAQRKENVVWLPTLIAIFVMLKLTDVRVRFSSFVFCLLGFDRNSCALFVGEVKKVVL
jgi:hypothetical protein